MRLILMSCALLALAACQNGEQQPANETAAEAPAGPVKGVHRTHEGKAAPDAVFKDPDGEDASLAEMSGKPLLVNLWATWCAPCVKELPTLDALTAKGGPIEVIAISQDMGPHPSVVAFLESKKIRRLEAYQDAKMGLSGALGGEVLPTSILFDAQGREVWRYVGDLDWTSEEAAKLLSEAAVARPAR